MAEKFAGASWLDAHRNYLNSMIIKLEAEGKQGPRIRKRIDKLRQECNRLEFSEFTRKIADFVGQWVRGIYHLEGPVLRADWSRQDWVELVIRNDFATYDFAELTELVLFAHAEAVRVDISAASRHYLRVGFYRRNRDAKASWDRHPSIHEAMERFTHIWPLEPSPVATKETVESVTVPA